MNIDDIEKLSSTARHIVEIVAILIAGWWAYNTFIIRDIPSLEESIQTKCEVEIAPYSSGECIVSINDEIKNIGKSSFDIDSVFSSVWVYPIDSFISDKATSIIDIEEFIKRHIDSNYHSIYYSIDSIHSISSNFVPQGHAINFFHILDRHYFPGSTNSNSVSFKFCKCPGIAIVVLFVTYPRKKGNEKIKPIITYDWLPTLIPHIPIPSNAK